MEARLQETLRMKVVRKMGQEYIDRDRKQARDKEGRKRPQSTAEDFKWLLFMKYIRDDRREPKGVMDSTVKSIIAASCKRIRIT